MEDKKRGKFFFAFTKPKNFSGQTAASELIISLLSERGVNCIPILLYPLTRTVKSPIKGFIDLFFRQIKSIPNIIKLLLSKKPILHLNLGQSYWSFIRVGTWYFPVILINRGINVVTSLHGSNFMTWQSNAFITRIFIKFLITSRIITVLGQNQKNRLIQLGLDHKKIRVVPNASTLLSVSDSFIKEKHSSISLPITILHLSLLIESKGFPIYLESLEILARRGISRPVRAILCGPITFSPYCNLFKSAEEKKNWIEKKVESIKIISGGNISAEWIPGATGMVKQQLFEDTHIFVFPTSFPVEAQPIVLLEALASGCSIITSRAGEISSTVDDKCAIFLEDPNPAHLADEIYRLINNPLIRASMALNGIQLSRGPLSVETHFNTWLGIFNELKN